MVTGLCKGDPHGTLLDAVISKTACVVIFCVVLATLILCEGAGKVTAGRFAVCFDPFVHVVTLLSCQNKSAVQHGAESFGFV